MNEILKDKRFAKIAKDPRFHRMKRKDRKVQIDGRFKGMFKDDRFRVKYSVDKRGRPVRTSTNENLQKYYDLSDSDADSDVASSEDESEAESAGVSAEETKEEKGTRKERDVKRKRKEKGQKKKQEVVSEAALKGKNRQPLESDNESEEDSEENEEEQEEGDEESSSEEEYEEEGGVDLARGEGNQETSSSSDSSDDDSDGEAFVLGEASSSHKSRKGTKLDDVDHNWGELDREAPRTEDVSSRLAVCNLDWDRIKAQDIFILLNSFKPTGGVLKSVRIYPSEFGKARMAEEDVKGPKELVEQETVEEDDEEGSVIQREKLRQYQLARLKYYYAVVECDSPETANAIYEECDGIEYESSATRVDLRFIPDGMEFEDKPTSEALSMPDATTYKPRHFTNTALQQSKVDLTWDETDKDRTAVTMRNFTKEDLEQLDMKDYLASSESELDEDPYAGFIEQPDFGADEQQEDEQEALAKYSQILKSAKEKDKKRKNKEKKSDMEMEISWDPGLIEESEKIAKKKQSGPETPWEQYLNKKKEKKKKKKHDQTDDAAAADRKEKEMENLKAGGKTKSTKNQDTVRIMNPDSDDVPVEGSDVDEEDAFSNDELPSDVDLEDDYFKEELDKTGQEKKTGKKGKKKVKKTKEEIEEENKRQAELSLLLMDEDDGRQHFSLKGILEEQTEKLSKTKRKRLRKLKLKQPREGTSKPSEDTFEVNVEDPRFVDIYSNPLFNIDPSAPDFKSTKATDALIEEKLRRRLQQDAQNGGTPAQHKSKRPADTDATGSVKKQARKSTQAVTTGGNVSLASLVKSVKAKTKTLQEKKQR